MAVQMFSDRQKMSIVDYAEAGYTRTWIANRFNCSTDTVRRVLKEMKPVEEVEALVPETQYIWNASNKFISITDLSTHKTYPADHKTKGFKIASCLAMTNRLLHCTI